MWGNPRPLDIVLVGCPMVPPKVPADILDNPPFLTSHQQTVGAQEPSLFKRAYRLPKGVQVHRIMHVCGCEGGWTQNQAAH